MIPVPVRCKNSSSQSDHDTVSQFLKAPLKQVRDGTYKTLVEEYKFLLAHIRRHHNEVIFLKCTNSECNHCTQHPVQAIEAFSFLRERNMKMFYPLPSSQHSGTASLISPVLISFCHLFRKVNSDVAHSAQSTCFFLKLKRNDTYRFSPEETHSQEEKNT